MLSLAFCVLGLLVVFQSLGLRSDWQRERVDPGTRQWGNGSTGARRLDAALGNIATGRVRYWGRYWWVFTVLGAIMAAVSVLVALA